MDSIDLNIARFTSVSMRSDSFRKLKAAQKSLAGRGIICSEQEIFRGLLQLYLRKWRGRGSRASSLRRYNLKGKNYVVKSLYIESGFSAALWTRAVHSGITISRMLDFAIRHYLLIYMNQLFDSGQSAVPSPIQYGCITWQNSGVSLQYVQLVTHLLPQSMPP